MYEISNEWYDPDNLPRESGKFSKVLQYKRKKIGTLSKLHQSCCFVLKVGQAISEKFVIKS